jgi:hypothetical protein
LNADLADMPTVGVRTSPPFNRKLQSARRAFNLSALCGGEQWTGGALVVIIVARETRHREGCGTGAEVGVDDEIEVTRPGYG